MNPTLRLVLLLLSPIVLGAISRKLPFSRRFFEFLRSFTTWVILPLIAFMYVGALMPQEVAALWSSVTLAVVGVATCFFFSCLFSLRMSKEEGAALVLNSSFMNVAHLGLPVVYLKLGSSAMSHAVIYAVTVAMLNLFLGTLLMHLLLAKSPSVRQVFVQTFTFPAVVLLLLAVLLVYLRAPIPQDLHTFFTEKVSPVFLLLLLLQVGYHLRIEVSRQHLRSLPLVGVSRFLLCPLVTLATCRLLGFGKTALQVSLYLSMMPPAFFNLILVQSLGLDTRPYSLTIFLLTLISFLFLFFL